MNKTLGIALLVAGITLLCFGLEAKDSLTSSVSQAVTGAPTNKTLWLIAGGAAAALAGATLFFRSSRDR